MSLQIIDLNVFNSHFSVAAVQKQISSFPSQTKHHLKIMLASLAMREQGQQKVIRRRSSVEIVVTLTICTSGH